MLGSGRLARAGGVEGGRVEQGGWGADGEGEWWRVEGGALGLAEWRREVGDKATLPEASFSSKDRALLRALRI